MAYGHRRSVKCGLWSQEECKYVAYGHMRSVNMWLMVT